MIVDFRNSADAESNNTDTYKRLIGDRTEGIHASELTNVHDPAVGDPTDKTAISEALDEQGECETTPSADEVP